NPPIDLAKAPLAILIVGVLTAIAVARGPRHHLGHCRSFPGEQKPVLVFEALQAARRDVVLDSCGGFISLRFSRKPFSHTVSPSSANLSGATRLSGKKKLVVHRDAWLLGVRRSRRFRRCRTEPV